MRLATYLGRDLENLCARESHTLREVMGIMNRAGLRLVPILRDSSDDFVGVIADGDLRRYLAAEGDLTAPVKVAMNHSPVLLDDEISTGQVRSFMLRRGIEHAPRVRDGKLEAFHVLWPTSSPQELTAVIMTGGLGTRLAPLTEKTPKPLLPIAGKPILSHIIEHLRDQGITRFILSVNYLADMIVDHYGDGSDLNVTIDYTHETMRMGTGGALGLIDVDTLSDPFICLNGDILNDIDVNALQSQHRENTWDATMVVRDHHYVVPYGVVEVDPSKNFVGAKEKPTMSFKINAGIYMLSKSVLSVVPRNVFYDLPMLFHDLQERGMRVGTYTHSGRWIDIGTMSELTRARNIYEGKEA